MFAQTTSGYLQEVPDFAESPEQYVGEYPYPGMPYAPPTPFPYPGQYPPYGPPGLTMPFPATGSMQPTWWQWPTIHWSWANQFRPWRQPPFLPFWRLKQPFEESLFARQMALARWQQQQGMAPGMMPGMMPGMQPGMPYPGMVPGMPGMPGIPGMPGQSFPGLPAAPSRSRGRRHRGRRRR